jgi:hypothetical protein
MQIIVSLAALAVIAAGSLVLRFVMAEHTGETGCIGGGSPEVGPCSTWPDVFEGMTSWEHIVIVGAAIVLGAFAGAALFYRELDQGTHVLALTQSVGPLRWRAVKTTVAGAPLLAGLLGVGFLAEWVDRTDLDARLMGPALGDMNFSTWTILPAAWGLVSLSIAASLGIVTRKVLASLAGGLVAGGIIVAVMLNLALPHLVPPTRMSAPLTQRENTMLSVQQGDTTPRGPITDSGGAASYRRSPGRGQRPGRLPQPVGAGR